MKIYKLDIFGFFYSKNRNKLLSLGVYWFRNLMGLIRIEIIYCFRYKYGYLEGSWKEEIGSKKEGILLDRKLNWLRVIFKKGFGLLYLRIVFNEWYYFLW